MAFVKYLASPEAQTKLMELKAALPVDKEVLEGAYSTSFDGAKVFADSLALRPAQALVRRVQRVQHHAPG